MGERDCSSRLDANPADSLSLAVIRPRRVTRTLARLLAAYSNHIKKQKGPTLAGRPFLFFNMAVRERFELSKSFPLHAFQACSFGHSDISPQFRYGLAPCCEGAHFTQMISQTQHPPSWAGVVKALLVHLCGCLQRREL